MNKTEGKLRLSAVEVKQSYPIVSEEDEAYKKSDRAQISVFLKTKRHFA